MLSGDSVGELAKLVTWSGRSDVSDSLVSLCGLPGLDRLLLELVQVGLLVLRSAVRQLERGGAVLFEVCR